MTIRSDWRALTIPALMLLAAVWLAPPATAKASSRPDVRSAAALVMDEASSEVLYARRATQPVPVASITKLMSALVVLESGQSRTEKLAITRDDIKRTRGSQSRLPAGARLSRGDLLHLSLMSSENRAAQALGRSYPGGLAAAIVAMNAKARALGMTQTRFVDPTGLSSRNVSSPADLAKLVIATSRNPHIREYSTDEVHTVRIGRHAVEHPEVRRMGDPEPKVGGLVEWPGDVKVAVAADVGVVDAAQIDVETTDGQSRPAVVEVRPPAIDETVDEVGPRQHWPARLELGRTGEILGWVDHSGGVVVVAAEDEGTRKVEQRIESVEHVGNGIFMRHEVTGGDDGIGLEAAQ